MVELTCTKVHTNCQLCLEKNTTVAMELWLPWLQRRVCA